MKGENKMKRTMTNQEFTKQDHFRGACVAAKVEITKRQASKFLNKKGSAYKRYVRPGQKKGE